ncbi:hypothetical protein JKP88DRAFT_273070 [Tribonema minus]|uniref:Uncharacterized protein n=1 Tax=Tribonema minus TaxID=303371 RepID=A0A835Z129_9STRA|nr:hypothetical protein JKP88DRAFT_273070 [Tribonema minus]
MSLSARDISRRRKSEAAPPGPGPPALLSEPPTRSVTECTGLALARGRLSLPPFPPLSMDVAIVSTLSPESAHMVTEALRWFNDPDDRTRAEALRSVIGSPRTGPSLRLMDHLAVHYSRARGVAVRGRDGVPVDLWTEYRRALQASGKRYFDAFKRFLPVKARVLGQEVETTLGQLRFLAWFQKLGMHDYLLQHSGEVRAHMQAMLTAARSEDAIAGRTTRKRGSRGDSERGDCTAATKPALHLGQFEMSF